MNQLMARAGDISKNISALIGKNVSFELSQLQVETTAKKIEIPEIVDIIARTFKGSIVGGN